MAGYPYYSPPPPSPPCNDTTPTLPPPPPPPPPACNHTTTPTTPLKSPPPPPSSYYSPPFSPAPPKSLRPPSSPQPSPPPYSSYPHYSPPCNTTTPTLQTPPPPPACTCNKTTPTSPSHSPPPSPACNKTTPTLPPPPPPPPCNTTSSTVSPPTFSSQSPPPPSRHLPPPPSPHYSPPQPSLSPLPLSPPPPLSSPPSPRSFSPPSPPPPSIIPPTYPPHKLPPPLISPPPPVSPPCHCVCPSPWALPPNNYYPSMAPSPQFLSPSNGHRTVVLTTFVSLGGVFFLAFITIGLLSMAIKKKMPRLPTTGQPDNSHVEGQGQVHTLEKISTSTSVAQSVITIDPDQKIVLPDQGAGHVGKEGDILQQTMSKDPLSNQSVPDKINVDPDVERQNFEEVKDDPNKRFSRPKPLSSVTDSTQGMDQESIGDYEPNDDVEKSDERIHDTTQDVEQESNADQDGPDNTTEDVEKESNAAEDESSDSKKPLRRRKKNNGRKGRQGGRKSSTLVDQVMKAANNFDPDEEEESPDDDNDEEEDVEGKSNADQGEPDNTTQDVENQSNEAEDESSDSKKPLHPRKKNNGRKGKQGGRKSSTFVDQATKAATDLDPVEEESQDDDNDEEEDVEQKSNAYQGEPDNTTQDVENESNAAEDELKKRLLPHKKNNDRKGKQGGRKSSTLVDQAMKATTNFDPDGEEESRDDDNDEEESQDVEQESNADKGGPDNTTQDAEKEYAAEDESKERLLPSKKNNGPKGKRGGRKSSTLVDQAMKAATNFDPNGVEESQDDDNDDEEVYDSPRDVERKSYAIKEESNDSKVRLRHHKETSHACKGKQGEKQSSKLGQARKATINFDQDGEQEYQDDENDDPEVQEVPQEAEDESNANQEESDESNHKPVDNQTETDIIDIAQDVEQESSAVEKESTNSKERLRPRKKIPFSGLIGKKGERESSTLVGQAMKAAVNVDLVGALQPQDYDNDEAEEEQSGRGRNELPNLGQIVTVRSGDNPGKEFKSFGHPDDKEVESEAYSSTQDLHSHKRHTSTHGRKESSNFGKKFSATVGANQGEVLKSLNVDQILTAPVGGGDPDLADDDVKEQNDDPVNECDDPSMEGESFVDDGKKEASKSFGSKKVSHLQKRRTGAQRRQEAPDVGQTSTAPIGGDVGVYLKSLADDYEKEENEDPSIECDDPNMEYELLVDDDAKEHKSDSFGSKKGSRLYKRQTGARGRRGSRNVGQIWSDQLGGDPSSYFKSLADDDKNEEKEDQGMECDDPNMEFESLVDYGAKEEESVSFGLKKVTRLQKRQIGGRGRKGPPNVGQILNIPTGSDAGVDLKFLADDDEKEEEKDTGKEWKSLVDVDDKQKELELFGRREVSRLHKGQTGAGGRKQPPNLGQIWTATTGSDPVVDLNSIATQVWASNIGESMTVRNDDDPFGELESHDDDSERDLSGTAANEGDQNADMEFHEEDPELESKCSNKGLGLHKPHAFSLGETETSIDDQSVFVTGDDDPGESGKVAGSGKPLSRPRTTGVGGKRRT